MDAARFTSTEFGYIEFTERPGSYAVYLPAALPHSLPLDEATVSLLSAADRALGRLAGSGRLLPNPMLLVNAYIRREAVSSSRIEGTEATLTDLFDAEAGGKYGDDVREVSNYVRAMQHGLSLLEQGRPISRALIEDIHRVLLEGVRGEGKSPGTVRSTPNWIGSGDPMTAVFVPPPADEMVVGLQDWEEFLHADLMMPPLVKCALLHYQFETLHPFLDGNGRLGRLLIIFFLVSEGHLPVPLLYVSSYFEQHKRDYYDTLQGVRERGEVQEWIRFFLGAVASQAADAVRRSEQLVDIREDYRSRLHGSRSRAHELIDALLVNPIISTASASEILGVTVQGAANLLRQLEQSGILTPVARIPGRSSRWVAPGIMSALTQEHADSTSSP